MKTKSIFLFLILFGIFYTTNAQVSGNRAYGNQSYNSNSTTINPKRTIYTTDTSLVISAKILLNQEADIYLVSVGLNQEEKTVKECNEKINERIQKLIQSLEVLGIQESDVYVDFISQTKIYDYEVGNTTARQFEKGFEIKKNLILRMKNIDQLDELLNLCAAQEVYDIIKVDYINEDVESTYLKMYEEALKFIEQRKKLYLRATPLELSGASTIASESFYSVYPNSQYKKYQAFETANLNVKNAYNRSDTYVQKEARKNRTFYYDGLNHSGFDRILNITNTKIGIQYVFELRMIYERKRD